MKEVPLYKKRMKENLSSLVYSIKNNINDSIRKSKKLQQNNKKKKMEINRYNFF